MAPLKHHHFKKVLLLYFSFIFFTSMVMFSSISEASYTNQATTIKISSYGRRMLELDVNGDEVKPQIKKKKTSNSTTSSTSSSTTLSSKNQTKLLKPVSTTTSSNKNQTKLIKPINGGNKNQTKITTNDTTKNKTNLIKPTKNSSSDSLLTKKSSSDLTKNNTKTTLEKPKLDSSKAKNLDKIEKPKSQSKVIQKKTSWIDLDEDDDLVSEIRGLPSKFQESFLPDMDKISKTSQVYLSKYNREITKNVKPFIGNKYANSISSIVSFAFIIIPLILVSLIFNRITAYFSLQKLLIFIQVYLSIYFSILCLSSLVTGLEPLKFFYATSRSTYVGLQVFQTLGYVLYLLLLLMYLVLVFSTESGMFSKFLGLGQTFVGYAVGLHYYMMVFHRAVLHQPPKTSWKIHGIYATCFLVICLLSRADRRKKAYLVEGSEEEGKKS